MGKTIEKIKQSLGLSNKCRFCGSEFEVYGFDDKSACPNRCEWKEYEKHQSLVEDMKDKLDEREESALTILCVFALLAFIAVLISIVKLI